MKTIHVLGWVVLAAACTKEQPASQAEAASDAVSVEEVSTRIVVRLTRDGGAEIVDVLEQPGRIPFGSVLTGDYAYEVRDGANLLAVESFGDPFEQRALFEGEGEHSHSLADSATVIVRVPGVAARGRTLDVRFHKLTRSPGVDRLDGATFDSLQRSGAYAQIARLTPETLSPRLSQARRLAPRIRELVQ